MQLKLTSLISDRDFGRGKLSSNCSLPETTLIIFLVFMKLNIASQIMSKFDTFIFALPLNQAVFCIYYLKCAVYTE